MKSRPHTHSGIDLRKALARAQELGCDLRRPHATDDVIVSHPRFPRPIRVSTGRKDCPRALSTWLNRLTRTGGFDAGSGAGAA
jgi:hypothetical protein